MNREWTENRYCPMRNQCEGQGKWDLLMLQMWHYKNRFIYLYYSVNSSPHPLQNLSLTLAFFPQFVQYKSSPSGISLFSFMAVGWVSDSDVSFFFSLAKVWFSNARLKSRCSTVSFFCSLAIMWPATACLNFCCSFSGAFWKWKICWG